MRWQRLEPSILVKGLSKKWHVMLFDAGESVQAYLPEGTDQRGNRAECEWSCGTLKWSKTLHKAKQ